MRIKRLDITGFKSFMERSVFSFDEGITGVVGPNGCGKSNIVDAIRWAMGEQSAKHLRGRGMEDVIFNGSESQPPLSMAEVSLTFTVEERDVLQAPYAGFPEITVTRRLFRNGESEYLINRTACRLLDVTEVFLGTGVGTKAYSIIEQGRVGLIVSAKPEDRRSLIEEAAGVTKYKSRRKAAERKMEYTQQNLLRVTDLVSELEKRLDSLARQAKKAEKYRKLRAQVREIELHTATHRYLALAAEEKLVLDRLSGISAQEQEKLAHVAALDEAIRAQREALDGEGQALQALNETLHGLESGLQRDQQNLTFGRADLERTQAQRTEAEKEVAALTLQREELSLRRVALEAELAQLTQDHSSDEAAVKAAAAELASVTGEQTVYTASLEAERAALLSLTAKVANHESRLQGLARQRTDLEGRRAKVGSELLSLREEEQKLERGRSDVAKRVNDLRQLALELAERKGVEEGALSRARTAFSESEVALISLREDLSDKKSRLSSIEEIQRNYEGFDRGVRTVMLNAKGAPDGIHGLVADVLSTSPDYEKAVEAVLGERLQQVLVEGQDKAAELVQFLKAGTEGRSTFLPLAALEGRDLPMLAKPQAAGVLALALDEVRCEPRFQALAKTLLNGVVIVDTLDTARALAQAHPAHTFVTVEGDVLRPDGSLTGGVLEGPGVGALQKKREVQELSEEVAGLQERYQEALTRHHALQKEIQRTEEILKGLAKNQHQEELNLQSEEKDLHRSTGDLSRLRERLQSLAHEETTLSESLAELDRESSVSQDEVAHAQAEQRGREERSKELALKLVGLKDKAAQCATELTQLQVKLASHAERTEGARRALEGTRLQELGLGDRLARLAESIATASEKLGELAERLAATEARVVDLSQQRDGLQKELEARRLAHAEGSGRVRAEDDRLKALRLEVEELTAGVAELSLREREIALEREHLVEGVRERHQTEVAHELHQYHLLPVLEAGAEQDLKELRAQLEKMGEINLTAIDEHQELEGRFTFLSAQKKDLESSLEQLRQAIVKIDKTSRERFSQTFELVNEKFQAVFPRLFGGGRAGLELTQEGPNGEQGVEIFAQPPGKKLQSVTLLSGGEKALTAVALIFAIFLLKPTPFCLLDEVDAPLDEGNVGRYNDMVKEMSKTSQFIVITHNKRTMEVVDTLYGVTMEEPGISKLVAVKMKDAVAANDEAPQEQAG
jgi:chromosome segregation protein